MKLVIQYLYQLRPGKVILWCYLIWYVVVVCFYFDPSFKLWMNSLGISAVIGTALVLSVSSNQNGQPDHWQTFRLYLMPFCVSSFAALIKDQGFVVIFSPRIWENLLAAGLCGLFLAIVFTIKQTRRNAATNGK